MNYTLKIPGLNGDSLVSWSQNVDSRNDAKEKERQSAINNMFNQWANYGKQLQSENAAEAQREYQAAEAEKARKFQADEAEKNRKAQADYNTLIKSMNDASEHAKGLNAAQTEYTKLLQGDIDDPAVKLRLDQIKAEYPEVDVGKRVKSVGLFPEGAQTETYSIADEVKKQKDAQKQKSVDDALAENNYQYNLARFRSTLPTTFKSDIAKKSTIDKINAAVTNGDIRQEDATSIMNSILGVESGSTATAKAVQSAGASHAGKKTTEGLEAADKQSKAADAVTNNTAPYALSADIKAELAAEGYIYKGGKWTK